MTERLLCLAPALLLAMPLVCGWRGRPAALAAVRTDPAAAELPRASRRLRWSSGRPTASSGRSPLPVGHSSPVIWGNRIFLTGFLPEEKRLETLGLDRASGRILWRRPVPAESIEPVKRPAIAPRPRP